MVKRELTDDEIVMRGQLACDLLNNQGAQLVLNELMAESVQQLFETEPKNFKEREDHYHMVRAIKTAVSRLQEWQDLGVQIINERKEAAETDSE